MVYTIEKNVPIPEKQTRPIRKYPWPDMEVGDSIFVENTDGRNCSQTMYRLSGSIGAMKPKKFRTRAEGNGVRVWRVE